MRYRSHLQTSCHRNEHQGFHLKLHSQLTTPPVNQRVSVHDLMIPTNSLYYVKTGHACIHGLLYILFRSQHNSESETFALPHQYLGASLDRLITTWYCDMSCYGHFSIRKPTVTWQLAAKDRTHKAPRDPSPLWTKLRSLEPSRIWTMWHNSTCGSLDSTQICQLSCEMWKITLMTCWGNYLCVDTRPVRWTPG